jgi:hypothetical protein
MLWLILKGTTNYVKHPCFQQKQLGFSESRGCQVQAQVTSEGVEDLYPYVLVSLFDDLLFRIVSSPYGRYCAMKTKSKQAS